MTPQAARSKNWGGTYWRRWYEDTDVNECNSEILTADCDKHDMEGDGHQHDTDDTNVESVEGSPLHTDDDRREGPADSSQHMQGGPQKSKLEDDGQHPTVSRQEEKNLSHKPADVENQNAKIAQLILALGNESTQRTVVRAVAQQLGIDSDDTVERLVNGTIEGCLRPPQHIREALICIGMGHTHLRQWGSTS